jgi:hypothetical protein
LLALLEAVPQVREVKDLPICRPILLTGTAKHTLKNTGILCSVAHASDVESHGT